MPATALEEQNRKNNFVYANSGDASGTAATATITAPDDGRRIVITTIVARYSSLTQVGMITVKDGANVVAEIPIVGYIWLPAITIGGSKNTAMSATLSAPIGGVTANITIMGFKERL
jgi:hypothetical protein